MKILAEILNFPKTALIP